MYMQMRQAEVNDFGAIAALIEKLNVDPVTQCIHSGDEAVSIQKQMAIWHEAGELAYVVAEAGNSNLDGPDMRFL